jgi:arylsulfatase A
LIVNWPGRVAAGKVSQSLVDSTDFLPTVCEAAGAKLPEVCDGRSFLPELLGQPFEPRPWIYCWYAPEGGGEPKHEFAMDERFKLYRDGRLFDLAKDWFEEQPLSGDRSAQASAAAGKLQQVLDQYASARPEDLKAAGPQPRNKAKKNKGNKANRKKKKAA